MIKGGPLAASNAANLQRSGPHSDSGEDFVVETPLSALVAADSWHS